MIKANCILGNLENYNIKNCYFLFPNSWYPYTSGNIKWFNFTYGTAI